MAASGNQPISVDNLKALLGDAGAAGFSNKALEYVLGYMPFTADMYGRPIQGRITNGTASISSTSGATHDVTDRNLSFNDGLTVFTVPSWAAPQGTVTTTQAITVYGSGFTESATLYYESGAFKLKRSRPNVSNTGKRVTDFGLRFGVSYPCSTGTKANGSNLVTLDALKKVIDNI